MAAKEADGRQDAATDSPGRRTGDGPAEDKGTGYWADQVTARVKGPQVVNDSKTPSGRAHVGALRGVLVHDAIYRSLVDQGRPVTYRFGSDDMDPLDELPFGLEQELRPYLGAPLCNVPAPPGSDSSDLATHFIDEFFSVFGPLGVGAEIYRMRDVYRSGSFNEVIDILLRHAEQVRTAYRETSGAVRDRSWIPLQVVCEQCGRIGTTTTSDYDGSTVAYRCHPDLVSWATGCGHAGRMSPFDGRAKLPWKVEWAAKWHVFGVTIEGAGKDHTTRGGSRDVTNAIYRSVFDAPPPVNVPYEFFLVGGKKMSSSRGRGVPLGEMTKLLPPDILRFVMLRVPPRRAVNFEPDLATLTRVFDDFDRLVAKVAAGEGAESDRRLLETARARRGPDLPPPVATHLPPFDTIVSIEQLPHIETRSTLVRSLGRSLTAAEDALLTERIVSARVWLEEFAGPEDRLELQDGVPESARALANPERAFFHILADLLVDLPWQGDAVQAAIFDAARQTPLNSGAAFIALYKLFLDRTSGPRAGSLLAFLDRAEVIERLRRLAVDEGRLWDETALTALGEVVAWVRSVGGDDPPAVVVEPREDPAGGGVPAATVLVSSTAGRNNRVRVRPDPDWGDSDEWTGELAGQLGEALGRTVPVRSPA